jgi:serine/threonine protein kinase
MKYCTVCKTKFDDSVSFCPTDGEVLEDDPSSIVGTVLDGQYNIESMLGKGGMGAVYLARHILLGDRVAIKILPPEVRNNAEWLRRFRREGQAARRFRHANAVTVYDLRTAGDGTIYMVMEYVEGHTLEAELKSRGRFSPAEATEILEPIMSVLNTAHAMGVVHRDLKPENIMIGKAGTGGEPTIKLLDLGIAKMREIAGVESSGTTELTMAGQVLGTPYYMSPEQWGELSRDGNFEIDGRADIYSLGLVVYQLIRGKRACSGNTLHELRREHLYETPAPLHEVVSGVSSAFSAVVSRAISKDRGDRQATAGEFASQLRAALGSEAGATVTQSPESAYPNIPASTPESSQGAATNADVNAPTVITVDAVPTTPPRADALPLPKVDDEATLVRQTPKPYAAMGEMTPSIPLEPHPGMGPVTPQKSRGKALIFGGVGALVLLLLLIGVGGVLAFNWFRAKPADEAVAKNSGKSTAVDGAVSTGEVASANTEFGRYWLEVLPAGLVAEPTRVAGAVPLSSGQAFKFNFNFSENGYVYIVGPGERNQPTAFLTAKPAAISGLESNQVFKGSDFSFPSGLEHWLELDKKPGTENYTIIFSPQVLTTPAFFGEQATGEPLSEADQAELESFLAQHKTVGPVTELNDKDSSAPFVAVKVPQKNVAGEPIIFAVRIQHK